VHEHNLVVHSTVGPPTSPPPSIHVRPPPPHPGPMAQIHHELDYGHGPAPPPRPLPSTWRGRTSPLHVSLSLLHLLSTAAVSARCHSLVRLGFFT
jgi:hypothetical protein